jgi:hypothetical protein
MAALAPSERKRLLVGLQVAAELLADMGQAREGLIYTALLAHGYSLAESARVVALLLDSGQAERAGTYLLRWVGL